MKRLRMATVWLDGCSGCHMSFLDIDERILELAQHVDLVYSPLVDHKEFPPDVDVTVTVVEGAVSSEESQAKIRKIRERTKILVAIDRLLVQQDRSMALVGTYTYRRMPM